MIWKNLLDEGDPLRSIEVCDNGVASSTATLRDCKTRLLAKPLDATQD